MDAYKCIRTKRDTRAYAERPIPREALRRILQAGRMAGSSKNSQPCRFVVLREDARKAELAACGQFARHVPQAPLAIAVVLKEGGSGFDSGRAAQNMMLAAWAEGITSCPVAMHDAECAQRVLGLLPDYRVAIVISLGYPEPSAPRSQGVPRLPLEEYVRHERW